MTFTDDDLKRLKQHFKNLSVPYMSFDCPDGEVDEIDISALVDRLEAAEDYCENQGPSTTKGEEKYKVWRKAAMK